MSQAVIDVIELIRAKSRERDYLLASLELWARAEAQGIDSHGGGSFGLDTQLFGLKDRARYLRGEFTRRDNTGAVHVLLYNFFRYPDGRVVVLVPMLKAVHHE
jgi:hypothetical protein